MVTSIWGEIVLALIGFVSVDDMTLWSAVVSRQMHMCKRVDQLHVYHASTNLHRPKVWCVSRKRRYTTVNDLEDTLL
jgi:hypothetical protein